MTTVLLGGVLSGVLSLALSSCSGAREGVARPASAVDRSSASASPAPTETAPPMLDDGDDAAAALRPRDPVAAAAAALQTWSRPTLGYDQWWAALEPLMNAQGRQDYANTDPAEIPALSLTGPAVVSESAPTSALVAVPTSIGEFGVRLTRADPSLGWSVSRFYFPTTQGPAGAGS